MIAQFLYLAAAMAGQERDPLALFHEACEIGELHADAKTLTPVGFRQVPAAARDLLSLAVAFSLPPASVQEEQLPNPMFRAAGRVPMFLVANAPEDRLRAKLANVCAVVWRGRDYVPARRLVTPDLPVHQVDKEGRPLPPINVVSDPADTPFGLGYTARNDGAFDVKAVAFNGWIALTKAPPSDPGAMSPVQSPGGKKQ